jgi:hypothetical protein
LFINNGFKKDCMKLYSQLGLLIALCTMITVHAMEPGEIIITEVPFLKEIIVSDMTPVQTFNYPTFEQELKLRLNKHPNNFEELNKSCQYMVFKVIGRNLIPQTLSSDKSFGEQLINFNYIDLLSQFLDHVPIEGRDREYRQWLTFGIKDNNASAVKVILDHIPDDFVSVSDVSLALDSFVEENSLPMIKLLLTRNVNLKSNIGADLLVKVAKEDLRPSLVNDEDKKPYIRILMISGVDHQAFETPWEQADVILTPKNLANKALKIFMSNVAAARDGLLNIVQKNEMKIAFIGIGDYSRRQIKDICGNNLLFYALLGKNKAVADKLLSLWPKMLWEKNFEGKAIIDHEQAMQNFTEMYLQDDELKPLAIMFSYLLKKIS